MCTDIYPGYDNTENVASATSNHNRPEAVCTDDGLVSPLLLKHWPPTLDRMVCCFDRVSEHQPPKRGTYCGWAKTNSPEAVCTYDGWVSPVLRIGHLLSSGWSVASILCRSISHRRDGWSVVSIVFRNISHRREVLTVDEQTRRPILGVLEGERVLLGRGCSVAVIAVALWLGTHVASSIKS